MAFRLVSSVKRSGSSNRYYVERIPKAVAARVVGLSLLVPVGSEMVRCRITEKTTTIRLSLRTSDPHAAKVRNAEVAAFFQKLWQSLASSNPIHLTRQQCVALAGEVFRAGVDAEREFTTAIESETLKPGTAWRKVEPQFDPPAAWVAILQSWAPSPNGTLKRLSGPESVVDSLEELEPLFGRHVDRALLERGIGAVDGASRGLILLEFLRAIRDAWSVQKRMAEGDFSPPPEANRFPEWVDTKPVAVVDHSKPNGKASGGKLSLKGLVDRWWTEAKRAGRSQSTLESYKASIHRLAAFLKHDDATAVSNADVIGFKDARIAAGVSLKTIKDSDLSAFKSVLGWAVSNGLLPSNPADGVKVLRSKRTTTRQDGFTLEEAKAILTKCLARRPASNERPQTGAAKRWVPWLCAYTGARVGEIVQLRKEDIRKEGDLWVMTITPEAGTVKDKEVRKVVLHPHLIEQGFPDFVKAAKAGYMFLSVAPGEDIRGKWRATKNRLAEFARGVVSDPRVKPNHGWRHGFAAVCREAGIEDSVVYAIGGWEAKNVGGRYGHVSLQAQANAFAKFPRFEVGSAFEVRPLSD